MTVIIRRIHSIICKILDRNLTKNVSNYETTFDVLRIKSWFSLWKIYSHVKYTFLDHIANIACFKNFVFWFFRNISCFSFEFNVIFSFFFSLFVAFYSSFCLLFSHFFARFVISSRFSFIRFFRRFDLADVEKMKSFWVWCETNHWLYIWLERAVCDENEIASKRKKFEIKSWRKSSHRELEIVHFFQTWWKHKTFNEFRFDDNNDEQKFIEFIFMIRK